MLGKSIAAMVCAGVGVAGIVAPPVGQQPRQSVATPLHQQQQQQQHKPDNESGPLHRFAASVPSMMIQRHRVVQCDNNAQEEDSSPLSEMRKQWFGQYENRLRRFSAPEKVRKQAW
jgi:hypothetical protein